MKKSFLPLFLILSCLTVVLITLFTGCKKNTTKPHKGIIPLSVDNYWVYDNFYYHGNNKENMNDAGEIKIKIRGKLVTCGEGWFVWGFWNSINFAVIRNDGLWGMGFGKGKEIHLDSASLFFKYPVEIGDEWYSELEMDTLVVIALEKEITVPAGTFKCIHYRRKSFEKYPKSGWYLAPGTGLIKFETILGWGKKTTITTDAVWNTFSLKEYKIQDLR